MSMENDYIVYESKVLKFSGKIEWKKFEGEINLIRGTISIKGNYIINKERNLIAANITDNDPKYANLWKERK